MSSVHVVLREVPSQFKSSQFFYYHFCFSASVKKLFEELDLFELECKLDLFRVRRRAYKDSSVSTF